MNKFLLYPFFLPVVAMPGRSYRGPRPALSSSQIELRKRLTERVHHLSLVIGERSIARYGGILDAMSYIHRAFAASNYSVEEQKFVFENMPMSNFIVEKVGVSEPEKIIVIGAHYDTVPGSPGADDNATGVAAVLELA